MAVIAVVQTVVAKVQTATTVIEACTLRVLRMLCMIAEVKTVVAVVKPSAAQYEISLEVVREPVRVRGHHHHMMRSVCFSSC